MVGVAWGDVVVEPGTTVRVQVGGDVVEVLGVLGAVAAGLEEQDDLRGEVRDAVGAREGDLVERFADGAAAAVVDPVGVVGGREDDAERRREQVVGEGQYVGPGVNGSPGSQGRCSPVFGSRPSAADR